MKLYDARGNPVDLSALKTEIAAPSLAGIRQVISSHPAQGLTPRRLAGLLRASEQGQPAPYLELAEEMEEKDLHYRSVLGTRKLAVAGLEIVVEAATEEKKDVEVADLVRESLRQDGFEDVIVDVLDALGKGFSVCEILWDASGSQWRPKEILWRDPRWFVPSEIDGRTILMLDDLNLKGLPLPPYKFIIHAPRIKSGVPLRGGLARAAAWAYLFKNYTIKDWVAFAEVYGQPVRLGKYGPSASADDIRVLREAIASIGSDAGAVIPDSMIIEFVDNVGKAASAEVYERLLDYLDKQVSKAVLGHSGSADSTPGRLGGEDEAREVRQDLLTADARQLCVTLNRQLVRPLVDLNLGPQPAYPRLRLQIEEPEDLSSLVGNIKTMVEMGAEVSEAWARDQMGIPDPTPGEKLLSSSSAARPDPAGDTGDQPPEKRKSAAGRRAPGPTCPVCGQAAHTAESTDPDVVDRYADRLGVETLPLLDGLIEPVRRLVMEAESMEQLRDGLLDLYKDMDPAPLGELIMQALACAELAGRYEVKDGR